MLFSVFEFVNLAIKPHYQLGKQLNSSHEITAERYQIPFSSIRR